MRDEREEGCKEGWNEGKLGDKSLENVYTFPSARACRASPARPPVIDGRAALTLSLSSSSRKSKECGEVGRGGRGGFGGSGRSSRRRRVGRGRRGG